MLQKKQATKIIAELLSDFTQSNNLIRTKRVSIWLPTIVMVGVFVATKYLSSVFSEWEKVIEFFAVMLEVLMVYLLAVRVAARLTDGIGVGEGALTVRYCSVFRFHTVILPTAAIAYIKIRRTPFQAVGGSCNVFFLYQGKRCEAALREGCGLQKDNFFDRKV